MPIGISEKHSRRWHPTMNNRLLHRPLNRSTRWMLSLYAALTQPGDHAVNLLLSYAEGDVVLRRASVDYGVDAKKPNHAALPRLRVKQQSTRPIAPAKTELETELVNVELDCTIQVNHGEVHLV